MTEAPAIAPAMPRSSLGILRIRLPIAMMGIPTNIQPTAKRGKLQKKNRKVARISQIRSPKATPDTNQQMARAPIDLAMRTDSDGFTICLEENCAYASD